MGTSLSAFVLDASMALAWHFPDESSPRALVVEALSDTHDIVVPRHWYAEVANGILFGESRPGTSPEERARFLGRLKLLGAEIDTIEVDLVFDHVLPLARAHRLTIYDAIYLELAERRGLPLASFDKDLNAAARKVGIALVEEAA